MLGSLEYLKQASKIRRKTPWVIYLGDFFDRGAQGHEVMLTLFNHLLQDMARVCVIVGNHDESLRFDDGQNRFHALVKPCEYADWINAQQDMGNDLASRAGHLAIELFRRMPRALFFPDGLLVAHGGVHHRDKFSDDRGDLALEDENSLNDARSLKSFVWKRASETEPRKRVNPSSSSGEFGYKNFSWFCEQATAVLGQPVERMIKGHDHHPERYCTYPEYQEHRILAVNNMCYSQGELDPFERAPCIARWINGGYPQVHRVRIPHQHIRDIQGE
jgi:UDP-2,3-diacylglucosamine pyrophosphatase LpxH